MKKPKKPESNYVPELMQALLAQLACANNYRENEKVTALLAEISWTHHLYILEKCKDSLELEFYIRMSRRHGWCYCVLLNQIDNRTEKPTAFLRAKRQAFREYRMRVN